MKKKITVKILGLILGMALIGGVAGFLYWYGNYPHHPATYANVPMYPGATNVQPNPANHDLYKEFTFTTPANFSAVTAFYEKVLTSDGWVAEATKPFHGWVGETKPVDERLFTHTAHKDYFQYIAKIIGKGTAGDGLIVQLTMVCVCYEY